ncbi:uncharacterized protein BO97DRAFT_470870 [Aspergillus homomorphus CBS 101889]|uniref:Uncharacterized protein n=1 Tax=Aspergillus homomorphus (strain CBS 101889) TaxID=1450537 RepID=A0A395HV64_ASPHC|nr:hypothetical protein BO97DRAFT_470870 [Aspergillus homomorphus CBS 101889]RAL11697.1 hypothetical protein BO97DRAFT_470870 [Aspergillus homomorphus CBS 101889]
MSSHSRGSIAHSLWQYGLLFSVCLQTSAAGDSDSPSNSRNGYSHGQPIPVTCLNRTIDSGEHITDTQGHLQYIPFPTCNETSLPLALHYGVSETVNCTIASLPDELYHLLEYYVHSDVPMTCRVPTAPLAQHLLSTPETDADEPAASNDIDTDGPSYTPLTFALQGTLQRSHLHIWTDMNLLVHNIAAKLSPQRRKKKKGKGKAAAGYVVAGTAYSVPEFDVIIQKQMQQKHTSDEEKAASAAVAVAAKDPWTAGHGTKVIRGEPLTFSFHVSWVEGGRGIGWPASGLRSVGAGSGGEGEGGTGFFSRLLFFVMAAGVGAVVALYWERNGGSLGMRRRRDEGILGVSASSRGKTGNGAVGITYGNGGRMNGYGGYSSAGTGATAGDGAGGVYGYGGYTGSGKRD